MREYGTGLIWALALPLLSAPHVLRAEEERAAPVTESLAAFSGSELSLGYYFAVLDLDRSAELTYDPIIEQLVDIAPGWKPYDNVRLSLFARLVTELTNSDDTARLRETLIDDVAVRGSYTLPTLPGDLGGVATLGVLLPTSKESRARGRYFGVYPQMALSREIDLGSGVKLTPSAYLRTTFYAASARSLTYDAPSIPVCEVTADSCGTLDHAGERSEWAMFREGFLLDVSFPYELSANLTVIPEQHLLYALDHTDRLPASPTNTNWRYTMRYYLEASYKPTSWLGVALGFSTENPQQKPNSSYYRPIFNRFTELEVTTTLTL